MFEDELSGLPPDIQDALKKRIEDIVRKLARRHQAYLYDYSTKLVSTEALHGLFASIFDLAAQLKIDLQVRRDE